MDILALLSRATVYDIDGFSLGEVFAVKFVAGQMVLTLDGALGDMYETGDDPDDGEDAEVPEEHPTLVLIKDIEKDG